MTAPKRQWLIFEAIKNVRSYALLSCFTLVVSFIGGYLTVAATVGQVAEIVSRHETMIELGLNIWRVQTKRPIPVQTCDLLTRVDGVKDSGAVISRDSVSIDGLPGSSISLVNASPGYVRIAWSVETVTGTGIGAEAATRFGIRPGSQIRLNSVEQAERSWVVHTNLVLPETRRMAGANQSIVVPTWPSGSTRECLVEVEIGARSAVEALLLAIFPEHSVISPLFADRELGSSVDTQMQQRFSQWVPLGVALSIILLILFAQFSRRADWALYQIAGVDKRDFILMQVAEAVIVAWFPFALGSLVGLALHWSLLTADTVLTLAAWDYIRASAILATIPMLATFISWRTDPLGRLKGE